MKKLMNVVLPAFAFCGTLASIYYAKNKKNMLDIIIEEIEKKY